MSYKWTQNSSSSSSNGWTSVACNSTGQLLVACLPNENPEVINAAIWYSTDYGSTWNQGTSADDPLLLFDSNLWTSVASNADGSQLIACANGGGIWISTELGEIWGLIPDTLELSWSSIASNFDGDKLIVCENGGFIWISRDSGSSWVKNPSLEADWTSVASNSDGNILVACAQPSSYSKESIWYSTDYGSTWYKGASANAALQSEFNSNLWTSVASNSAGDQLVACADYDGNNLGGIWYSTDNGANWSSFSYFDTIEESFIPWSSIASNSSGDKLVASGQGYGIWTSSDSGTTWSKGTSTDSAFSNSTTWTAVTSNFTGDKLLASSSNFGIFLGVPNTPCFKEDTKILTNQGYKPIQDLRKGDLIKTLLHGFKPIELIGKRDIYHDAILDERLKDQLYTCSKTEYPELFEDLVITGCHSILVDKFVTEEQKEKVMEINGRIFITDNKYRLPACVDERAKVYPLKDTYTIYHLALENDDYYMNYGIYANGLLVESCSKRYLKELSNMELIE
jgi:hypothetical protein